MSTILAPLYTLLHSSTNWHWTSQEEEAFQSSKKLLTSDRVLVHFKPKLELRLSCDASNYGLGAVLFHLMPNGDEKPIGFASRTLSKTT